jgi:nucleoside-diphosphate-sugar epimerase
MRVLVTGAAGFLGSHLIDRLVADGHEVAGIDNLKRGNLKHIQRHIDSSALDFRVVDIRDQGALDEAMTGAEVVYHLAAQSNVMGAFDDADYSFQTNVVGTYNVLQAAQQAGVQHLVFSSSREVYGEPKALPASEDVAVEPKNPYGASKLAGEAYCRVWRETLGLPCTILRFGNLYGPRDSGRVIPIWLELASKGEDLVLYGGQQVLDFVWVGQAVEALIRAASCPELGPINVANGQGTSLQDLAQRIQEVTGTSVNIVLEPPRQAEVTRFVADVRRMQDILGLVPASDPLSHLVELLPD